MYCPRCGKQVNEAGPYCGFCGNPVGTSESPSVVGFAPVFRVLWKLFFWAVVILGVTFLAARFYLRTIRSKGQASFGSAASTLRGFPASRSWRGIGQVNIVSQSLDVPKIQGWTVQQPIQTSSNLAYRFTLHGRFAASEPLFFVIIDPQNFARMQSGYPPLIQYSAKENESISTPWWPAVGTFYGFVRPDPRPAGFPTSIADLALQIIARTAVQNRPPARVTAELYVSDECFCTQAEAQAAAIK